MHAEEFLNLTDIAIETQEIELESILKEYRIKKYIPGAIDIISREYTGIDEETDIIISCILHDIQGWIQAIPTRSANLSGKLLKSTNKLPASYKKYIYLVLENIIELLKSEHD
jgi:hypothetical protein